MVRRTTHINIAGKTNSTLNKVCNLLCTGSRCVYNSSLYVSKQTFFLSGKELILVIDNLDNYNDCLSLRDRLKVARYAVLKYCEKKDVRHNILLKLFKNKLYSKDFSKIKSFFSEEEEDVFKIIKESSLGEGQTESIYMSFKEIGESYLKLKDKFKFGFADTDRIKTFIDNISDIYKKRDDIWNENEKYRIAKKKKKEELNKDKNEKHKPKKVVPIIKQQNILLPSYPEKVIKEMYVREYIEIAKKLPSQVVQQTIKKEHEAYLSFFSLKIKGEPEVQAPNYNREKMFNCVFQNNSFKIINEKHKKGPLLRLSLGNYLNKNFFSEINVSSRDIQKMEKNKELCKYLYIKLGKKFKHSHNVKEIKIVPLFNGVKYRVYVTYEKDIKDFDKKDIGEHIKFMKKDKNELKKTNMMSIDLGVSLLATIYTTTNNHPILIDGKPLVSCNEWFNKKIGDLKSNKKKAEKIHRLFIKREQILNNIMHKISRGIVNYAKDLNINYIIVGYNKNWKNKVDIGRKNNRRFYQIPYRRLVNNLFYKCQEEGIYMKEQKESYTSKTDSLANEKICRHKKYKGKRIRRGLFSSSKNKLIHADVNAAINILRKFLEQHSLKKYIKKAVASKKVFNPIKVSINNRNPNKLKHADIASLSFQKTIQIKI